LLVPKKDKYKVCFLIDKALPNFGSQAFEDSQFCQALRNQNRSKDLVWHYINIDARTFSKSLRRKNMRFSVYSDLKHGLLICTFISGNQGLEKSRF
jgi:hypothetical protein